VTLPDLDADDARPIHEQIAARLREAIESGDYAPGDKFPGENVLMKRYRVARWTAREALSALIEGGYLRTEPKVGTFVRDDRTLVRKPRRYRRAGALGPFATEAREASLDPRIEAETDRVSATAEVAARLEVAEGADLVRTRYRYLGNGHPVQLAVSYEPTALTSGTPIERPEAGPHAGRGVILRFDAIGIHIDHVDEEVRTRAPRTNETRDLAIPRGVHVFHLRRTHRAQGRPVETADIVIPGDRYVLHYSFRIPDADEDPATD
jgi:DNA-binding GntR family transcriptional regulator